MKKIFQNKLFLFALFNIIVVGALYTRCDMQEDGKKWPMKGLKKNDKMVPAHSPDKSQTPAPSPTKPPEVFVTPTPEEEKKILSFATFIDEIREFDKANKKEIQTFLNQGYVQFPKQKNLQKKTAGQVHFIPVEVKLTGEFISKVVVESRSNESFKSEAYPFFGKCARDGELPTTVRALCLSHYLRWAKDKGDKIDTTGLPKRVIELSNLTLQLDKN